MHVVAKVNPAHAGAGDSHRKPQAEEVVIDKAGQVDPGLGACVVPQVEPRIHFEQMEAVIGSALEIALGDSS